MLWTGKQVFSTFLRPDRRSDVLVNLEAKARTFSNPKDLDPVLDPKDGCICLPLLSISPLLILRYIFS
jgi:DNA-directed RNA polymerase III subunit RPC1